MSEQNQNITFEDLNLSKRTLFSLKKMGYEKPTEVQQKTIPVVMEGKDLIAQAQTGTGKTAAFGIPIVEKVNPKKRKIQALVLVPTRELAIQVAKEIKDLGKDKRLFVLAVYGGKSIKHQIDFLRKGLDVVIVGTPGRVKDLINRGHLKLDNVEILVLDEADRMLDMGFIDDITDIINELPKERQTLLFSATMPREILNLAEDFLKEDYEIVRIKPEEVTVDRIKQIVYRVDNKQKFEKFTESLKNVESDKTIVFTQTKRGADELARKLKKEGFQADAIHGDFSQAKRESVLRKFRTNKLEILVATDVAARGLDIKGIEVVYNYDIPQDVESYIHRIGRTGRAGKEGTAISFSVPSEDKFVKNIMKKTKADIEYINESNERFHENDKKPSRNYRGKRSFGNSRRYNRR
jgi:ATP-dependent RNA helicase DeaD